MLYNALNDYNLLKKKRRKKKKTGSKQHAVEKAAEMSGP